MQPSEEDITWFKSTFHPIPRPTLPDDCIEYSIHVISSDFLSDGDSERRLRLRQIQKHAENLQKQWLKGYIWQRQGFSLELMKTDGISYLIGRTEYGDSIEDEWVIVWLLKQISKEYSQAWIKVTDSDGEFLLIEASGTIPRWLEPEVAENRVWINDDQLKILKPAYGKSSSRSTTEKLSLQDAYRIVLEEPKRIMHSMSIEEEAFYRLRNYPAQINDNSHHAVLAIPRKVAFLLIQKPAYVAPAIEAFYLRDPVSLKILQKNDEQNQLLFPPEQIVMLSVKFPKVAYAQVKSQEFPVTPQWKKVMPSVSDVIAYGKASTGMKITTGFEMLLLDKQYQDRPAVREMKMLLDDLASGDENLPTNTELAKLGLQEDDEAWLDINFDDLEHELSGQNKGNGAGKKREFGDAAAQENLRRIVKQFEQFLNEDGDIDSDDSDDDEEEKGVDKPSDDSNDSDDSDDDPDEDKDASFDEDQFTKMMQEMMGMPSDVMKEIMSGTIDALSKDEAGETSTKHVGAVSEVDESSDDDTEDMLQMEAELRASGALDLNTHAGTRTKSKAIGSHTSTGQQHVIDDDEDSNEEDEEDLNDFDEEFARNLLQSFRSSGGKGGPAANLVNMVNDKAADDSRGKNTQKK